MSLETIFDSSTGPTRSLPDNDERFFLLVVFLSFLVVLLFTFSVR